MSVQHVVLFSFPTDLSAADAAEMRHQITRWPALIGGMSAVRFGTALRTDRTRGYQYLLYMEFPDLEALTDYQNHPVHRSFLRWVLERDCTPLAFDYPLDSATLIHPPP